MLDTQQQMASPLSAFSMATKACSEDQRTDSKKAPPPLLSRLSLAQVLSVAATHTKESTSATTTGPGDTPWGTTTQDPLHVPLLYLGACKITSDEVHLSCLINYYSLKMYRPPLKLARVMQSGVSGMLLTYLHGSRHDANTYVLGLPTTIPWLSSLSSIRQPW